jgi:peptide-methionine (S)-S-oxide reductase
VQRVAFGGGCHWCTEAIFQSLKGVSKVEQGWISSTLAHASTPSEAVIVHFNLAKISLDTLIDVHLFTHNATSNHTFRLKYRSAVYTFSKKKEDEVNAILKEKQKLFSKALVTKAYPFDSFRLNEEKYLNYYKRNPEKPFCKVRINPKLKTVLERYAEYVIIEKRD